VSVKELSNPFGGGYSADRICWWDISLKFLVTLGEKFHKKINL